MALGRRFDASICLKVAEHLPSSAARMLIELLCFTQSDLVFFSAAVPGQPGEAHLNCQWPAHWQAIFNDCGYSCADDLRPLMWDDDLVEPWYRQNIFVARRDRSKAGKEPRIRAPIYPDLLDSFASGFALARTLNRRHWRNKEQIEAGSMPARWYLTTPWSG